MALGDFVQMNVVNSIATDSCGNIYVQSRFKNDINVFCSSGEFIKVIPLDTLHSWCIKIFDNKIYYGASCGDIKVYDLCKKEATFTIRAKWLLGDSSHNCDGRYTVPSGFCLYKNELFVVDTLDRSIICFSSKGIYKWKVYTSDFIGGDICPVRIDVNESYILVSFAAANTVVLLDRGFEVLGVLNEKGGESGCFEAPWDVCLTDDYFYVADLYNHRVQQFSYSLEFVNSFGSWGRKLGEFNYVYSFDVTNDAIIFADSWNHGFQIWKWKENTLIPSVKVCGVDVVDVLRPSRVKIIEDTIVVTDYLNHCFKFFNHELSKCSRVIGGLGFEVGDFRYPTGIDCVDGVCYMSDARSGRVTTIDIDGKTNVFVEGHEGAPMSPCSNEFINYFNVAPSQTGVVKIATDIVIDSNKNIYVADLGECAILKFSQKGDFLMVIGKGTLFVDNKTSFIGCSIFDDVLYVTNPGRNSILIYSLDGVLLKTLLPSVNDIGLNQPTGISVNSQFIAIADRLNHRVVLLNHEHQVECSIGKLGSKPREFCAPWDVALNGNGELVVADSLNNRIQKILI